ncbi:tetratricopeptide repeat protein [Psychrobacter sp. 1U2]|uniref:tetratricopeptide repeat protein n=1 Tax=Psychrobacter sp. 1U2 TaxID=3453577 RepID=UPI003F46CBFF
MSACQTAPSTTANNRGSVTTINQTSTATNANQTIPSYTDDGYPIEPYIAPNQTPTTYDGSDNRQNPLTQSSSAPTQPIPTLPDDNVLVMPLPDVMIEEPPIYESNTPSQSPTLPSHSDLLERARRNSQQSSRQTSNNKSDLPAFQNLMQVGTAQLQSGNLTAAENSFTRAQRLAPRSSAVYFYLSQVALKKNQPRKAEAMARRGLTVSQDANRRRSLWQLILRSGQAQNNTRVIREAQQALR